jgi:hypothetical protein
MAARKTRAGKTITRSISIDAETDRLLRERADESFGGNLSSVIVAMAKDEAKRAGARAFLDRQPYARMTNDEAKEFLATHSPKKRRKAKAA